MQSLVEAGEVNMWFRRNRHKKALAEKDVAIETIKQGALDKMELASDKTDEVKALLATNTGRIFLATGGSRRGKK